jgi:hypothetical protein
MTAGGCLRRGAGALRAAGAEGRLAPNSFTTIGNFTILSCVEHFPKYVFSTVKTAECPLIKLDIRCKIDIRGLKFILKALSIICVVHHCVLHLGFSADLQ